MSFTALAQARICRSEGKSVAWSAWFGLCFPSMIGMPCLVLAFTLTLKLNLSQ